MPSNSKTAARRYLVVTAVATPANILVTWLLLTSTSWAPLWCNLVSATILTIPTFIVSARWVWPASDAGVDRATAFWVSSLVNVGIASIAMWLVGKTDASDVVLSLTPFTVYTLLWVLRFAFLDRVVFVRRSTDAQADTVAVTSP